MQNCCPPAESSELIKLTTLSVHLLVDGWQSLTLKHSNDILDGVWYPVMFDVDRLLCDGDYRTACMRPAIKHPADTARINEMYLIDMFMKRRMTVANRYYSMAGLFSKFSETAFRGVGKQKLIRVGRAAMVHANRTAHRLQASVSVQLDGS